MTKIDSIREMLSEISTANVVRSVDEGTMRLPAQNVEQLQLWETDLHDDATYQNVVSHLLNKFD